VDAHEQSFIKDIINAFLREPTEGNMDVLIQSARKDSFSDEDVFVLANGLARSGEILNLQTTSFPLADIPSTGGPSSLSTLLCPLFLVYFNNAVVKLGVAGRPAGGIDALYQIKNYNIAPGQRQIKEWVQSCRYVHFIANEKYASLDAKLFAYRKVKNYIDLPPLVIASLLAKKMVVGLNVVGLDIRVSKFGNFGKSWNESRILGARFNKIAALAGIKSKCFLTNGDQPQQNYIGRGEALLALSKIFSNSADNILNKHYLQCLSMASSVGNKKNGNPSTYDLKKIFFNNVITQQGIADSFFEIANKTEKEHLHEFLAEKSGFLHIDIYIIRDAIVEMNIPRNDNPFPDNCGVILRRNFNDYINKGEVICTYRSVEFLSIKFRERIAKAFSILSLLQNTSEFEEVL
jgi:thymidine phosphorylase